MPAAWGCTSALMVPLPPSQLASGTECCHFSACSVKRTAWFLVPSLSSAGAPIPIRIGSAGASWVVGTHCEAGREL